MKTAIAVTVGYLAWSALWLGGNAVIQSIYAESISPEGAISDVVPLLLALVLSIACSLLAGVVASAMAKQGKAVAIMTALLLATGIGVQVGIAWDLMPVWFHLTFLALIVPCCVVGGKLRG